MSELMGRLRAFEGTQLGPAVAAPDAVNQPMIRHWCDAIGDDNPVYTQPELAAKSIHGEIIAPPAMLQAWVMPGVRGVQDASANEEMLAVLDSFGFFGGVATNCAQEYQRPLRLGDRLTMTRFLDGVSDEKRTALGVGHFISTRSDYRDAYGELVSSMRLRVLKFNPSERKEKSSPGLTLPTEPLAERRPRTYAEIEVGDRLPPLEVALTRTLIVATAIASRDYEAVHHDPTLAQESGTPDIFMNILTTNGFVGRFLTDWAGPNATLRTIAIRLGVPNFPGDTMRVTGVLTSKADGVVGIDVRGANSRGDHVTGTATLTLP